MPVRLLEDNEIRERFRELRKRYGSQGRVAKALGVSQASISEWETEGVPPIDRRAELAKLVGEPVTYLLVHDDGAPPLRSADAIKLEVIGVVADESISLDAAEKIKQSVRAIVRGEGEDVDGMRADTEGASPFGDGRDDRRKAEPK